MNLASNGRGVTGSNLGKPTYPGKRELSSKLQLWTSSFPQKDCQQDFSTDDIRFVCSLVNRQVKVHPRQSNFKLVLRKNFRENHISEEDALKY